MFKYSFNENFPSELTILPLRAIDYLTKTPTIGMRSPSFELLTKDYPKDSQNIYLKSYETIYISNEKSIPLSLFIELYYT